MGGSISTPADRPTVLYDKYLEGLASLEGKVIAITGCTTGTGFVAALTCAKKGAHVLMLNRASERADAALSKIKEAAPDAKVEHIDCDLTEFESVKGAAKALVSKCASGIDVLCNNAGVAALADKPTKDGYDIQMQTNHLSHFLLTREIYPLLEKAAAKNGEARIVNHSSGARKGFVFGCSPLEAKYLGKNSGNLGGDGNSIMFGGGRWERYHQTKLANVVWTLALKDKLESKGSKVKALCAAPGGAATNLIPTATQDERVGDVWFMSLLTSAFQSAEDGTLPLLECMFKSDANSGDFFEPNLMGGMNGPPALVNLQTEKESVNEESRKMIWEESCKAVGDWDL